MNVASAIATSFGILSGVAAVYFYFNCKRSRQRASSLEEELRRTRIDHETALQDFKNLRSETVKAREDAEEFVYVASHDLQEPLRTISGFLQLLQRRYGDQLDPKAQQYITFAVFGARRMSDLVRGLLQYSRAGRHSTEKQFTPRVIIEEVLAEFSMQLGESNAKFELGELPQQLYMAPDDFRQVISHLLSNALKFRADRPLEIKIAAQPYEKGWLFTFKDNGIGIAENSHQRIFQIFQRLHEAERYEGIGLGLSLAKKLVDKQGGRIWVESQIGLGSSFHFYIPGEIKPDFVPDSLKNPPKNPKVNTINLEPLKDRTIANG